MISLSGTCAALMARYSTSGCFNTMVQATARFAPSSEMVMNATLDLCKSARAVDHDSVTYDL